MSYRAKFHQYPHGYPEEIKDFKSFEEIRKYAKGRHYTVEVAPIEPSRIDTLVSVSLVIAVSCLVASASCLFIAFYLGR